MCRAACHKVELGTSDEVLEVNARGEEDVHRLDVLRGELVERVGAHAADADAEGAQFAQLNLVAVEQLLHQTLAHVRNHSLHRTSAIHSVVVGNVLGKLLQRPYLRHLVFGVSLLGSLGISGILHHKYTVINHFFSIFNGLILLVGASDVFSPERVFPVSECKVTSPLRRKQAFPVGITPR